MTFGLGDEGVDVAPHRAVVFDAHRLRHQPKQVGFVVGLGYGEMFSRTGDQSIR